MTKRTEATPSFYELIRLRKQWKEFHEKQDRQNADRVFQLAGVDRVTDSDLKFFPHLFSEKLNEFGRDWERSLAVTALKEGYAFYRAELLINIEKSATVYDCIESLLSSAINPMSDLPLGTPLFFESNGLHALKNGSWDSLFYFVLHPTRGPNLLAIGSCPGIMREPIFLRIA